ncbi:hypothetical protein C8J57DRAFT_1356986 [Mycena rebaudengoi]|nr:hypothetical protein C8J57DRAFT_1356986 [Mycena rebaudengoi]
MSFETTVVCAVAGHPDFRETLKFPSHGYRYTGDSLLVDMQALHDAQCSCATRIENAWRVALKPSEMEPVFTRLQLGDEPDSYSTRISPFDILCEHFPFQPQEDIVSIVCDTALPESPTSSSFSSSTNTKRSRTFSNEESVSGGETDSEPDRKRANTSPCSASDSHLELPYASCHFLDFRNRPRVAFVDKTRVILHLSERYRHLHLRPPRFGKTTFLTTLMQFYDLHAKNDFTELFGPLSVAAADPGCIPNQHLCISFDLSAFDVLRERTKIASSFQNYTSHVVGAFLRKYVSELGILDPENFVRDGRADLLTQLFTLVRDRGHTLFIGVDEYDTPSASRFFAGLEYPYIEAGFAPYDEIECLVDSCFWGPIRAASDVIPKLFVTGTYPLKSPRLKNFHMLDLTALPTAYPSCGFTPLETLDFAQSTTSITLRDVELRRSCGEYFFSSEDAACGLVEPVLHPQRVIAEIASRSAPYTPHGDSHSFVLLERSFSCLPETSDVAGAVTTQGLIDLLVTGAVEIDEHMDAPLNVGGYTMTWSILYHLGALTHDRQLEGALRAANSVVLSQIHDHVDSILADRYDLYESLFRAFRRYTRAADPEPFLDVLSSVLRDQVTSSYGKRFEPDLRGVFELVVANAHFPYSDRLVDGIEFFSPDGVTQIRIKDPLDNVVRPWELRTLTLRGIWRGTNMNDDEPSLEDLQKLHEELMDDDEEHLLDRPYRIWSPSLQAMETVLVRSFLEPTPEVPLFLAVGGARVLARRRTDEDV